MKTITIQTVVNAPVVKVWDAWTKPEHITKWAFASDDWEAPHAESDVRKGGRFLTRMSAKDKSNSFDFTGTYTHVVTDKMLEYTIDDGRKVAVAFQSDIDGQKTNIVETFEMESINSEELQRAGWQAILDNFKKYVERV